MLQPTIDDSPNSMEDLDILLTNPNLETASSTEEISSSSQQQEGNGLASLYEIDIDELNMSLYPEQLFRDLLDESPSLDQFSGFSPGMYEINDLLTGTAEIFRSTESDDIDAPIQSATDEQLAMIKTSPSSLPVLRPQKIPTKPSSAPSISLSRSVAVTNSTPNRLQLVYPLEDTYRPRYKSDYFPSKGRVRSPRYVADNAGHHYVSLHMPAEYSRDWNNEYIRVILLTTHIDGLGQFYSPYKFQRDNDDLKVADENPIYLSVLNHRETDSTIRLHLVLIKSKLDQLNQVQPLIPFSDTVESVQNIIPSAILTPKELIAKYQLDKAHIAFTLCTKLSDGTFIIHSETTVISSVITELPTKPTAGSTTTKTETTPATSSVKKISCPNCAHCFELTTENEENQTKRKSTGKSATNNQATKKKKLT